MGRILVRPAGAARGDPLNVTVAKTAWDGHVLLFPGVARFAGLRVALTEPVTITSLRVPIAARVVPRPGSRVRRGTVVRITPRPGLIGSPAVLKSHPHYRVPSFIGRSAQSAVEWAQAHAMFWAIPRLPPLPASSQPHLLDAYRVVAQRPRPGRTIVQGVMVGQGFRPTPLTVTVVRG